MDSASRRAQIQIRITGSLQIELTLACDTSVRAHAHTCAEVAPDEGTEVGTAGETEHGRDLLQAAALGLGQAQDREGHDSSRDEPEEEKRASWAHGSSDHHRSDEGTNHVGRAPIHAGAQADGLSAHTQGHDLGDVQPGTEAPRNAEGEHVPDDHSDDRVAGGLGQVIRIVRGQGDSTTHDHGQRHRCHTPNQERAPAQTVNQEEPANGVAQEEEQGRREGGEEAGNTKSLEERAAEGHHRVNACDDLEELHKAAEDHNVPEIRICEDLAPSGASSLFFLFQLCLHHGQLLLGYLLVPAPQRGQDLERLLGAPGTLQEARRLAAEDQADRGDDAQQDLNAQRDAPAHLHVVV
mmetsp:Transcript_73267/g.210446  ORF Transcript_73267/g.210446 Transcript_73267/m.210446 type:complete len:352 (+) Transcript_73267:229-1284(+)